MKTQTPPTISILMINPLQKPQKRSLSNTSLKSNPPYHHNSRKNYLGKPYSNHKVSKLFRAQLKSSLKRGCYHLRKY